MENMSNNYAINVKSAIVVNPTFKAICEFNKKEFPENGYMKFYPKLDRGKAILNSFEECNAYLVCYGDSHYLKMYDSYTRLFSAFIEDNKSIEVIDWGGGQALASCVLLDYIKVNRRNESVKKITLIEPSIPNIERGKIHLENLVNLKETILTFITKKCENVLLNEISTSERSIKIHLFSNILDMNINSKYVSEIIKNNYSGINYFVCVSPCGYQNILTFSRYFTNSEMLSQKNNSFIGEVFRASSRKIIKDTIYRNEIIFKIQL